MDNKICFYENSNLGGWNVCYGIGSYNNIYGLNIPSNRIGSIKIPTNLSIDMYQDIDFAGYRITIKKTQNINISDYPGWDGTIASFQIYYTSDQSKDNITDNIKNDLITDNKKDDIKEIDIKPNQINNLPFNTSIILCTLFIIILVLYLINRLPKQGMILMLSIIMALYIFGFTK